MGFEIRIGGTPRGRFESEEEAVAAAKQALADDPNAQVDVIDLTTGHPAAPGASAAWREELRNKVGF